MVRGVVLFLFLSLLAGVALADPVVDQSYLPAVTDSTAEIGSLVVPVDFAQTFTVGVPGTLTSVEVQIARGTGVTSSLIADVRTTTAGSPGTDAAILASITMPAASVPTSFSLFAFDFTAFNLGVNTGDVLAFVLRSADTVDTYDWNATRANGYSGGGAFVRLNNGSWGTNQAFGDMLFQTWVEPVPTDDQGGGGNGVPEPSFLALAAVGLALARLRRRR
jgi:MYXO-CTERM domain-containing protein